MIAVTASFLCSALLGLRLTVVGFLPVMLLAAVAAFALQGAFAALLMLIALQTGFVSGVLLRAVTPFRAARPALRRAVLR